RVFVEEHDGVHTLESREDLGPLFLRRHRPLLTFVSSDGTVGVEPDDEGISQRARRLEVPEVAWVKQIENAVGEYHHAALIAKRRDESHCLVARQYSTG